MIYTIQGKTVGHGQTSTQKKVTALGAPWVAQ